MKTLGVADRSPHGVGRLGLVEDDLAACVSCGLCLPHCPTYRVTGFEIASPRGRIAAMRAVQHDGAPVNGVFERAMEECVQCRGCETACPSGVPFGHLMETTRVALEAERRGTRPLRRRVAEWAGYRLMLPNRRLLLAASWFALLAQRLRLVPRRLGLPRLSARALARPLRGDRGGEPAVWLFTGCVMDAWQRDVHRAASIVMTAAGATPALPRRGGGCCGALHAHAGRIDEARRLAQRVVDSMPGFAAVVVDSAGCGAAMKDYGRLLGIPAADAFSSRVRDFSEWVVEHGAPATRETDRHVVVQDPCHLRHVQDRHGAVRTALRPAYTLLELDDEGLCCGAGGAYAVLQPVLATAIRDRKVAAIRRAAGDAELLVVSANPGCAMHLAAAGIEVRHPAELLADALEEPPRA